MIRNAVRTTSVDRVRNALERRGIGCSLKEVVDLCPELTWHQVFLAIDHLSQEGYVRVTVDAGGAYKVWAYQPD